MIRVDVLVTLTVTGPFLTKSSAPGDWGLDEAVARNGENNPVIPGTLIIGKLRQSWEEIGDLLMTFEEANDTWPETVPKPREIGILLGDVAYGKERTSRSKRLLVKDFVLQGSSNSQVRYRIRIDQERGAAMDRAQLLLESPFAAGESIKFHGTISFLAEDEAKVKRIVEQIKCGLQWMTQLGAYRGQGFGRLEYVEIDKPKVRLLQWPEPASETPDALDLEIRPQTPFCVDATTVSGNLFRSSECIPGNVILGCLYEMLGGDARRNTQDEFALLRANLPRLRVRHAFPSVDQWVRPAALPQSLVQACGNTWDIALEPNPCLIDGEAPSFMPDWKDTDSRQSFGWPKLKRELRVRTAVDSKTLRAADEQLFSYDMVCPEGTSWLSRIDLAGVPETERSQVALQIEALLSLGLVGLGKTKAIADVSLHPAGKVRPKWPSRTGIRLGEDERIVVTLQTDALLLDYRMLDETSGAEELLDAYRETWKHLSQSLHLEYFFARQALKGGGFLAARYQRLGESYYPWIMTRAGSVFVFSVLDQEGAEKNLRDWLCAGLPLAKNVREAYAITEGEDEQWQDCPYVPHNGYGEIAVNLAVHEEWRPKKVQPVNIVEEVVA